MTEGLQIGAIVRPGKPSTPLTYENIERELASLTPRRRRLLRLWHSLRGHTHIIRSTRGDFYACYLCLEVYRA